MEFLGIGPLELLIILLVALLLLGPRDMAKTGKTIGKTMRKVVKSPHWRVMNQTSREIRNLPNRLMREAGLDEVQSELDELNKTARTGLQGWTTNTILPPRWSNPAQEQGAGQQVADQDDLPAGAANQEPGSASSPAAGPDPEADLSAWLKKPD